MAAMTPPSPPTDSPQESRPHDDIVGSTAAGPAALRGSAMLGISYASSIGLSLISVPLLIRHLGISAFGRYTTVVALVTIVNGLTDAGLANIALREWSTRTGEDRRQTMRSLLGLRLELSAVGVLVGVGFAALVGYGGTLVFGTLLAGTGVMMQALNDVLTVPLQGQLRFGWPSVISVARQAVSTAVIVALVLVGAGLLPFFAASIPAGLLTVGFTIALVRRTLSAVPRFRGTAVWPLLRDTLPYGAAIAINALYFRITIIVMSLIARPQQTGYFATSFRVTEVLIGVPALAIGAAFPILSRSAREDRERFAHATERIIELSLMSGVALALAVVLSAPFVIRVLAGAAGAPAVPVLQIQSLTLVATFVSVATGFVLLSLRRHSALLIANSTALAANIVLALVLVPVDQARGAAAAAVIAESCLAVGQLLLLERIHGRLLGLSSVTVIAVAGVAGATPLLASGVNSILRALGGLLIYVGVLAAFGRIPPELRHALDRGGHD